MTGNPANFPVPHSADIDRILALPELRYDETAATKLAWEWSPQLLNDRGKAEWQRCMLLPPAVRDGELARLRLLMRPEQAWMLYEFCQASGLVAGAPVGTGKTWAIWMTCVYAQLAFGCRRPVLLHPASIEGDLRKEFRQIAEHWIAPPVPPQLISYQMLSRPDNADLLRRLEPDWIGGDEADVLRSDDSTMSKRVGAYIASRPPPVTRSCWFTGTLQRWSMRDYAKLAIWALGYGAPVPITRTQLREWSKATDRKLRDARKPVGALRVFAKRYTSINWRTADWEQRLAAVREGLAVRREITPGFVTFAKQSCDKPITIRVHAPPKDELLDRAFHSLKTDDATFDGLALSDPLSNLRVATQLGCGFYTMIDPPPPQEWKNKRNVWARFVRDKCRATARSDDPLDSEARVAKRFPTAPEYLEWTEIRKDFKAWQDKYTKTVPLSTSTAQWAVDWLRKQHPALIWVQHHWIGETIARLAGIEFYNAEGKSSSGRKITNVPGTQSAVLTVGANYRGRNLQDRWCRNLIVGPWHSGERWEQMMGRTHRQGQVGDEVSFDILITSVESIQAIESAMREAGGAEEDQRMIQKLRAATWDWSCVPYEAIHPPLDHPSRARWTRRQ